jgi:hypothetical protein
MLDSRWWMLNRSVGRIQHQVSGIGAAETFRFAQRLTEH